MLILDYNNRIKKLINNAEEIYIMGHKHLDLDALGACLGMYRYAKTRCQNVYIIIDDQVHELGCGKIIDKVRFSVNIIRSDQLTDLINKNSLLILVDTNKAYLTQSPDIVDYFENVLVIDHHEKGDKTCDKGLVIIDTKSSSACEMVSDFLFKNRIALDADLATYLLSGIVLDTNNYVVKSTNNTFKISYLLTGIGASSKKVQYLLKQDLGEYIERQKVITNVKIIGKIAYTKGLHKVIYKREDLAKIADTLLFFNKIEASFVMGRISSDEVGISARSMGNINVGKIMEKLGGGGSVQEAAVVVNIDKVQELESNLLEIIELL